MISFLQSAFYFILLISVVVFIHEYGHYYFAKKYKVTVTDFSIGFGKELFGWFDKDGTRWKVCLIPLGGYVKFFGDSNAASKPSKPSEVNSVANFFVCGFNTTSLPRFNLKKLYATA